MNSMRIGAIIHGALGDCYEQLCAIRKIRTADPENRWIGFFPDIHRLAAMSCFDLDMLDEIYTCEKMPDIAIDRFYQFQINDIELRRDTINKLPEDIKSKFDFRRNIKPWHFIRAHNFNECGMGLRLSEKGKKNLGFCFEYNGLDETVFQKKTVVGYLWRQRSAEGPVKFFLQRPAKWIIESKSELFRALIDKYDAHVIVSGMNLAGDSLFKTMPRAFLEDVGFRYDENRSKYSDLKLDLPEDRCTYLRGLGYAAEMEIMSRCHILLMMPSGFSEALWMKRKAPVILLDPAMHYILKLWYNRMPFFDNYNPSYLYFNSFVKHSAVNVMRFLEKERLLA